MSKYSVSEAVASEMSKIIASDSHTQMFYKKAEESEDPLVPDECSVEEKFAAAVSKLAELFISVSSDLDNIGLEKASALVLNGVQGMLAEAAEDDPGLAGLPDIMPEETEQELLEQLKSVERGERKSKFEDLLRGVGVKPEEYAFEPEGDTPTEDLAEYMVDVYDIGEAQDAERELDKFLAEDEPGSLFESYEGDDPDDPDVDVEVEETTEEIEREFDPEEEELDKLVQDLTQMLEQEEAEEAEEQEYQEQLEAEEEAEFEKEFKKERAQQEARKWLEKFREKFVTKSSAQPSTESSFEDEK